VQRFVAVLVRVLLGLVLLYAALRFGLKVFYFLRSPWSRDYGEGAVLAMVQVLGDHGNYFTSLRDYPLVTGNYPPVFNGLVALGFLAVLSVGGTLVDGHNPSDDCHDQCDDGDL